MTTNPPRLRKPPGQRLTPALRTSPGDPVGGRLRRLEELLADRDRAMGEAVRLLIDLEHDEDLPARIGGMSLQVWLEHTCSIRGADARALLGSIDVLVHLPAIVAGLCDRWLSWSQVQAIARAARRAPIARLPELDSLVAGAMIDHASFEPDALVEDVWAWVDQLQPSRLKQAERAAGRSEFLSLSPQLFGGGSLYGEFGPASFATIAEAVAAPPVAPIEVPDDLDQHTADELFDTLDEQRRQRTRNHGRHMAGQLVNICAQSLAGHAGDGQRSSARPLLLATTTVDALLDDNRTPGWLLHALAGGRMKVSSDLLQRLVDQRGADLRTITLDDCGQVVGVGRRTYLPPGWLRQAIWARDLAVRDPDGSCAIRRADLDHVREWPDGATDVTNLHAVGRRWHNHKTAKTWTVTRARDGTTTWRHKRRGWLLRLAPAQRSLNDPPRAGPARASPPDDDP